MSHFHDDQVRQALLEFIPDELENIQNEKFGEISGP